MDVLIAQKFQNQYKGKIKLQQKNKKLKKKQKAEEKQNELDLFQFCNFY